jgi:hypothetical protein
MGYILDIHEAARFRIRNKGHDWGLVEKLRQKAMRKFAELNGWQTTTRYFGLLGIGKSKKGYEGKYAWGLRFFDHTCQLKYGNINAAIVTEPYNCNLEQARQCLEEQRQYIIEESHHIEYLRDTEKRGWRITKDIAKGAREEQENIETMEMLDVYCPPDPFASIWNPGGTYFFVVAEKRLEIKWLDDQDGRLADRWISEGSAKQPYVEKV